MSRHLGSFASDYVQRRLRPARLAELDRHVMTCPGCRVRADEERALLSAMRTVPQPSVSPGLRETLLGLASAPPALSEPQAGAFPTRAESMRPLRLPVVQPATPALHRSPVRATVLAGLAASASAVVAWGLAAPVTPTSASPSLPNVVNGSSVRQAAVPPTDVVSSPGEEVGRSASALHVLAPPVNVVSFTGAQTSLGRPAVLTERLGR